MTQGHLDRTSDSAFLQAFEAVRFRNQGRYPRLDDRQRNLIRTTWASFVQGDPTETGMQVFIRMFELYPRTKDKFEFARGTAAGQFQNNNRVIFHVTRVIKYISIVVDNIDNLAEAVPVLKLVGGRHGPQGYNIPQEYYPYLGRALIDRMNANARDFNRQAEDAWNELWGWISDQALAGHKEYTAAQAQ